MTVQVDKTVVQLVVDGSDGARGTIEIRDCDGRSVIAELLVCAYDTEGGRETCIDMFHRDTKGVDLLHFPNPGSPERIPLRYETFNHEIEQPCPRKERLGCRWLPSHCEKLCQCDGSGVVRETEVRSVNDGTPARHMFGIIRRPNGDVALAKERRHAGA